MAARRASATLEANDLKDIGWQPLFAPDAPRAQNFKLRPRAPICDIVMKGGVTSGVVYPYAVLRLAQKFRLAGIGGTSAGAIAAAMTAAAEYARQAQGDHLGYSRFEARCAELPGLLARLFQPHRRHRGIFSLLTALMKVSDSGLAARVRLGALLQLVMGRASLPIWTILAFTAVGGALGSIRHIINGDQYWMITASYAAGAGLISGLLLLFAFGVALWLRTRIPMIAYVALVVTAGFVPVEHQLGLSGVVASALGGALGIVAGLVFVGDMVIGGLRKTDYGVCSGLKPKGSTDPAITDWLHSAIQEVAGRSPVSGSAAPAPLTFRDIETAVKDRRAPGLALRMITTNMTLRRPYALPDLGGPKGLVGWKPEEWRDLFPADVVDYMVSLGPAGLADSKVRLLPDGLDLPIVVGARMSLSFPVLFSAVPIYEMTIRRNPRTRMLLIDGGLSSNMPLHFFDTLGPPAYPTFAFNLDNDPKAPRDEDRRISLHRPGQRPPRLTAIPASSFLGYLKGLLGAAKDWQDNLLSIMPGQYDRIVNIQLRKDEGGLNLTMPAERSRLLMRLGYRAGDELATYFDLEAHRVRRALAAYQEIERTGARFGKGWKAVSMAQALNAADAPRGSRMAWRTARTKVIDRLGKLATWAAHLHPKATTQHFPRPRGSLRITPNLSGDF